MFTVPSAPKKRKWEWKWMKIVHKCSDGWNIIYYCQSCGVRMLVAPWDWDCLWGETSEVFQFQVAGVKNRGYTPLHSTRKENVTEKCLFECWGFLQIFHDTWECSYLVPRSRIQGLDPSESGVNGNVGLICSNQLVKLGILDYPISFIWTIINPLLTHSHLPMARLDGPKSLWQCWASCVEWGVTVEPSSAQKTTECWAMFELWAMKNLWKIHEISMKYSEMNCFRDA